MLINSGRHTASDLHVWAESVKADRAHARSSSLGRAWRRCEENVREFIAAGPCWCGVSWGKDSVVAAHLALSVDPTIPLRWIRVEPIKSPDCEAVKDAFLHLHPMANYQEVEVWCERDESGWHATGTLERGVAAVESKLGGRTILGIRAEESPTRAMRVFGYGPNTQRRSAPLGSITQQDVFALMELHGLPVHPAYAMTGGGRWPRRHLRVSSLGGKRGEGHGRAEWEQEYYGDVLRRIGAAGRMPALEEHERLGMDAGD